MKDIYEIRRIRLAEIIRERFGGQPLEFAKFMGYEQPAFASRLLRGARNIGSNMARRLEERFDRPAFWMDSLGSTNQDPTEAQLLRLFRELSAEGQDELMAEAYRINIAERGVTRRPLPAAAPTGKQVAHARRTRKARA